jgi:hypothetical protein
MKNLFIIIITVFFVVSCANTKSRRVNVTDLVSASSENVSFAIENEKSVDNIVSWIYDDVPGKAVLSCKDDDILCDEIKHILERSSIPYEVDTQNANDNITFIYERVSAVDCKTKFGCSVSVNLLQSVTDRYDFVEPSLLDPQDAQKAVNTYNHYQAE